MSAEEKPMDSKEAPKTAKELREALVSFVVNSADEADMSDEEVASFLQEEGIDVSPQWTRVQEALRALEGQERLSRAREARTKEAQLPGQDRMLVFVPNVRAEIQRLLDQLGGRQPQMAFRSLDEATEEDLQAFLAELQEFAREDGNDDP